MQNTLVEIPSDTPMVLLKSIARDMGCKLIHNGDTLKMVKDPTNNPLKTNEPVSQFLVTQAC